jgi:hypothetical protein
MGNIPMPILRIVTGVLVLCAVTGFALGINQTIRHATEEDEAPIAGNLPANAVIKDAQPLAPPPPPPAPVVAAAKPAAEEDTASDQAEAPAAAEPKSPVPTEAAPGAPPGQAPPAPPPPSAELPPT